ncbi:hypothetical protein Tco_0422889 [Tanacetum coccineum]
MMMMEHQQQMQTRKKKVKIKRKRKKEEIDNQTEESESEGTEESGSEGMKEIWKIKSSIKGKGLPMKMPQLHPHHTTPNDPKPDNDKMNNNDMKNDSVQEKQDTDKDENAKVDNVKEKQGDDKDEIATSSFELVRRKNANHRDYMQTLTPTLKVESNVIDTYCLVLNHEQGVNSKGKKTKHFFYTGMIMEDGKKYDDVEVIQSLFCIMKNEFKKDDEVKKFDRI